LSYNNDVEHQSVRVVNNGLGFIYFLSLLFLFFIFSFILFFSFTLLFFILDLGKGCDVTLHVTVTKHNKGITSVIDGYICHCHRSQSYDTEKYIENSGTNNII